ncbi:hypothetical protein Hypma_005205 [Hypsizygus marmoreus]|uniref:Uncharacterized protein n=1 Tax=Hypsizygus marmoreus TaxID=39966 RepID=A0A369JYP2_HYPMA|nr:hypothetical protein Hypma_005205 [Hypsizygus marmoreus]
MPADRDHPDRYHPYPKAARRTRSASDLPTETRGTSPIFLTADIVQHIMPPVMSVDVVEDVGLEYELGYNYPITPHAETLATTQMPADNPPGSPMSLASRLGTESCQASGYPSPPPSCSGTETLISLMYGRHTIVCPCFKRGYPFPLASIHDLAREVRDLSHARDGALVKASARAPVGPHASDEDEDEDEGVATPTPIHLPTHLPTVTSTVLGMDSVSI